MKYSAMSNRGGDCPSLDGCQVSTPHEGRLMFSGNDKQRSDAGESVTASDSVMASESENTKEITG